MDREKELTAFSGIRADAVSGDGIGLSALVIAQKSRLFLFSPVLLAIGIALYFSLKSEPSLGVSLGSWLTVAGIFTWFWPLRLNSRPYFISSLFLMGLLLIASGFTAAKIRTVMVASPMLERPTGPVTIEGKVVNIEFLEEGQGARLLLDNLLIENLSAEATPHRIRIKVRNLTDIQAGDRVSMLGALNPPSAPVAPGSFDFQRFAFFKQIGGFGFAYRDPVVLERNQAGFALGLEKTRHIIGERIVKFMPAREAGIANALMTGERASITEADMEDMRNSGLVHIISISGLHVTMIAGVIFFTLRFLMACFPVFTVYHPIKKYAAAGALIITILYMCLVGATVPTVRSVIMTGLVLLAVMLDRIPVSLRVVAIAALIILLVVPEAVVNPSFQMSFMAVMGLVAFYEATRTLWVDYYKGAGWFKRGLIYLLGICLTTVIASFMTAPYSIYHFQQFANYGLLANLLAVPLTSFVVMPSMLLAYVLMPLGIDGPALWLMGKGLTGMLWVSKTVAGLPYAVWLPPAWPLSALIMFSWSCLLICLFQGWARLLFIVPVIVGVICIHVSKPPDILVSGSGKLTALRSEDVYVSNKRADRFSREAWMKLLGQGNTEPLLLKEGPVLCDEWACRYEQGDKKVSFSFHDSAHASECDWANILIAEEPVKIKGCKATTVIDVYDLKRKGAYALWLNPEKIISVGDVRGSRPWTLSGNGR